VSVRLTLALDDGGLVLPTDGMIAVLHPHGDTDLSGLPRERVQIVQPFKPDFDAFSDQGFTCSAGFEAHPEPFAATVVILPRAKALTRDLIARAAQQTSGVIVLDGAKTDGIDSLLREVRKRVPVQGAIAKAHGKIFWFDAGAGDFSDWRAVAGPDIDGFRTAPGVFSADGIDPASALLASALPDKIGARVADFGAGWGYLSAHILKDARVRSLDLVEADHDALDCARQNITDPRARFHWADALRWKSPEPLDAVVMNPPFHIGRAADPALGRGFIEAAARALTPRGQLWLVANRHLPYETTLGERFATVTEVAGDNRFKVLHATRPSRPRT